MRIAFDHQAFGLQKTGGISRYFVQLAEQLECIDQIISVFSPVYRNQYARQLPRYVMHGVFVKDYPPRCATAVVALNGVVARRQIKSWQPDVVHETYFSNTPSAKGQCPTVLTVFDMIGELGLDGAHLQLDQFKALKKYVAVERADHIICISECTRQDLIRLYGTDPKKISVVHLGCDVVSLASETKKGNSGRPYLLYVGLRSGYKNFNRFVQAFAASAQLRDSFDIVAFGGGNLTTTEQDFLQGLQLRTGEVRQIDGDDEMLAQYYCNASALVYPSSYEGFGLPPLEAMAYRCPVVSSNASVMPEVIGDAAEFFDPLNIDSIACAIQNVVLSPSRVKNLVAKGLERVTQFNWRRCAEEHLAVYEKLTGISKLR